MVTMPGMSGMFGAGGMGANPYAGMNPYGGGMLSNAMGGAGIPGMVGGGGFDPSGMKPPQQPGFGGNLAALMQAYNANPAGMQNMAGPMAQAFGQQGPGTFGAQINPGQGVPMPGWQPPSQADQARGQAMQQGQGGNWLGMLGMGGQQGQPGQMPQGQMPPGGFGGILSGLMGGRMPWGPQQQPRGVPRQMQMPPQARQPVRPPAPTRAPRRAVYGGGSAGNISLSGY